MKKGLKKALAAVIALTMLMSMSVCAFAANLDVVTEYTAGESTVSVTATVTGIEGENQQVAFLAKKGDDIIWIDQKPASGASAASTFTTSKNNVGAIVSAGTTSLASSQITGSGTETIELKSYTVTVNTTGEGKVDQSAKSTEDYVTFTVAPANGYKLGTVTSKVGDAAATEIPAKSWIGGVRKIAVTANTTFTFNFVALEESDKNQSVAFTPGDPGAVTQPDVNAAVKTASVFATATGATEYGILVSADADEDFAEVTAANLSQYTVDAATGIRKYPAMGAAENGNFAIELKDTNYQFFVEGASYKACVYALGNGLSTSDVFTLALPTVE